MKKLIKKILKEEVNQKIIQQIDSVGLFNFMKLSNMKFKQIVLLAGEDWLTNKIMCDFIKETIKNTNYFSVYDIDYQPIFYNETEDEYREISYFGETRVMLDVFDKDNDTIVGEFNVSYEALNDRILLKVFLLVMDAFEKGLLDKLWK